MSETKINTKEGTEKLTILKGEAVVHQKPNEIEISNGAIDAPADFLGNKLESYEGQFAHVEVNYQEGTIVLILNEKDANGMKDVITGSLKEHELISSMDINNSKKMSKDSLIDLIRLHRAYFLNPLDAAEIIKQLRSFVASVEKKIELADDQRGNTRSRLDTAIKDIKLKDNFKIKIPLFKGINEKKELSVDICVDTSGTGIQFYLISDDLFVLLIEERERLLSEQISKFAEFNCSIVKVY